MSLRASIKDSGSSARIMLRCASGKQLRKGFCLPAVLGLAAVAVIGLAACSSGVQDGPVHGEEQSGHHHDDYDQDRGNAATEGVTAGHGDIDVVASFYPLAFLSARIGGEKVTVTDLTPSGGHAHDLELSPQQVASLGDADLVFYLGDSFQPAVEKAVSQEANASFDGLSAVNSSDRIPGDAHIWLDPMIVADLGDGLAEQLAVIASDYADEFRHNAAELRKELEELDKEYRAALRGCSGEVLITSHEAFGYMTSAYGLEQVGVTGVNPDAEPSPKRIHELEKVVRGNNATTLFFEEQGASSTEQRLATSLGVNIGRLYTLETAPTDAEDFLDALHRNLDSLRTGLDCAK